MKKFIVLLLALFATSAHASYSLAYQAAENVRVVLASSSVGTQHYLPVIQTLSTAIRGVTVASTCPSPLGLGIAFAGSKQDAETRQLVISGALVAQQAPAVYYPISVKPGYRISLVQLGSVSSVGEVLINAIYDLGSQSSR